MELQKINCTTCGKVLCEANGEVKKICPKCGKVTHVVVTSFGIVDLDKPPETGSLCTSEK